MLTWPQMLEKTRQYINPLVSESLMVDAVSALHDMGEVSGWGQGEWVESRWMGGIDVSV